MASSNSEAFRLYLDMVVLLGVFVGIAVYNRIRWKKAFHIVYGDQSKTQLELRKRAIHLFQFSEITIYLTVPIGFMLPFWLGLGTRWIWPTAIFASGVGVSVSTLVPLIVARRSGPMVFKQFIEESSRLAYRDVTPIFWGTLAMGIILLIVGTYMLMSQTIS